jgi:hypothetical protein
MFDYGTPPPSRRRRRGGGRSTATIVAAAILLVAVMVVVHPWTARTTQAATESPSASSSSGSGPQEAVTSPSGQLTLGACIDPTSSLVASFAPSIRADLAQGVRSLAPSSQPVNTGTGTSGQEGVDLTIRQVDTNSFSSTMAQFTDQVDVPSVPSLDQPRPLPGSSDYVNRLRAWSQGYVTVSSARSTAATAAKSAADSVASLPLDTDPTNRSAISACVSGLLVTVGQSGRRSFLLASDLQENKTPQLQGSFAGAPLVIIQACDNGNSVTCSQLLAQFTKEMRQLNVGQITVIRPEDATQAINEWIHGEAVTP